MRAGDAAAARVNTGPGDRGDPNTGPGECAATTTCPDCGEDPAAPAWFTGGARTRATRACAGAGAASGRAAAAVGGAAAGPVLAARSAFVFSDASDASAATRNGDAESSLSITTAAATVRSAAPVTVQHWTQGPAGVWWCRLFNPDAAPAPEQARLAQTSYGCVARTHADTVCAQPLLGGLAAWGRRQLSVSAASGSPLTQPLQPLPATGSCLPMFTNKHGHKIAHTSPQIILKLQPSASRASELRDKGVLRPVRGHFFSHFFPGSVCSQVSHPTLVPVHACPTAP